MKSLSVAVATKKHNRLADYLELSKIRLSLTVVFSALMSYLIAAGSAVNYWHVLILAFGGFSITAAANTFNQILEKDFDKLMKRTMGRPLAAGRMRISEAVLFGGLLFVVGIILLALFNPLAAILGSLSVVMYAFLYTPLKRITPASVFVGAIPGALPCMIGVVAADGGVTYLAVILFSVQLLWQFPHFWSIGYLGFNDYHKAGFKLVPTQNGKVHPNIGLQSAIYAALLTCLITLPYFMGIANFWSILIAVIVSCGYVYFSWLLQVRKSVESARNLMYYSFAYMPLVLVILYFGIL